MWQRIAVFLVFLCILTSAAMASDEAGTYVLSLVPVPPRKIGLTTRLGARWETSGNSLGTPDVVIDVYKDNGAADAQRKWMYSFYDISVGDEVALQGTIYHVNAVKYADGAPANAASPNVQSASASFRPHLELEGGCGRYCGDFVSIVDTGVRISPAEDDALVLSGNRLPGVIFFHGLVEFQMKLDSLKRELSGKYEANIEWRRGNQLTGTSVVPRPDGVSWSADWIRVTVHSGDFIELPLIGRLRVESIMPSQLRRPDWVVMVPAN